MQITLLVGLPGSGKTTAAKNILGHTEEYIHSTRDEDGHSKSSKKYIGEGAIILDDIRSIDEDLPAPGEYKHIIITDVYLCFEDQRELALNILLDRYSEYDPKIIMVFFENAPKKCNINSKHREDDDVVLTHIKELSEAYHIPEGAPVEKIWQPKPEPRYQFAPMTVNGKTYTFV